jgi:hypothetical protein
VLNLAMISKDISSYQMNIIAESLRLFGFYHYTEETLRVGRKMSGELAEPILIADELISVHKQIPKFDNPTDKE